MITFIVLASLEVLSILVTPEISFAVAIPSLIFVGSGLMAVLTENTTLRLINFWVWLVMSGTGVIIFFLYLVLGTAVLGPLLIPFWIIFLGLVCPLVYLECGVAWFYIEEAKAEKDDGYST